MKVLFLGVAVLFLSVPSFALEKNSKDGMLEITVISPSEVNEKSIASNSTKSTKHETEESDAGSESAKIADKAKLDPKVADELESEMTAVKTKGIIDTKETAEAKAKVVMAETIFIPNTTVAKSLPAEKKVILYNDRKGKVKIKYLSSDGNKKKVVMEGPSERSLGDRFTIWYLKENVVKINIGGKEETFNFSTQGNIIEHHIK